MSDYRSYYEEEEKTTPRPASRWLGGLLLGLLLGGIVGFAIGSGNPGDFFDDMQGSFASEGVGIVFTTIIIIGVAMLKSMAMRRNNSGNAQAARWVIMMFLIALVLAFGVLFFAGS